MYRNGGVLSKTENCSGWAPTKQCSHCEKSRPFSNAVVLDKDGKLSRQGSLEHDVNLLRQGRRRVCVRTARSRYMTETQRPEHDVNLPRQGRRRSLCSHCEKSLHDLNTVSSGPQAVVSRYWP